MAAADTTAKIGLLLLAITTSGVVLLVFDVVLSWTSALVAALATFVSLIVLWAGTPWLATRDENKNGDSVGQAALRDE